MKKSGQMEMQEFSRFRAEAQAMLAMRTGRSSRFLDSALSYGTEFEPVGCLAGCFQIAVEDHPSRGKAKSG